MLQNATVTKDENLKMFEGSLNEMQQQNDHVLKGWGGWSLLRRYVDKLEIQMIIYCIDVTFPKLIQLNCTSDGVGQWSNPCQIQSPAPGKGLYSSYVRKDPFPEKQTLFMDKELLLV